jgi:hypothetical protein
MISSCTPRPSRGGGELDGSPSSSTTSISTRAGNTHYYEATAWSYVLSQARGGVYGELTAGDLREVTATYRRHYDAFREYVEERQPSAWMHYGRYLVSPD